MSGYGYGFETHDEMCANCKHMRECTDYPCNGRKFEVDMKFQRYKAREIRAGRWR